jgi:hypothetical protein
LPSFLTSTSFADAQLRPAKQRSLPEFWDRVDRKRDEHDVKKAERDAEDAEEDAADALDYATWAVDQAQLAVLHAIDARTWADERAAASPPK